MHVSEQSKYLAKYLRGIFLGEANVKKYSIYGESISVDIMTINDCPSPGIITHSTLNLSSHSLNLWYEGREVRAEIVFPTQNFYSTAPSILSTCALSIVKGDVILDYGTVAPNVLEVYGEKFNMKHIMFSAPFILDLKLKKFEEFFVTWFQAIPISQVEYRFLKENGVDKLEELFEETQVDVFDLDRPSAI